jgi:hypothetical protein
MRFLRAGSRRLDVAAVGVHGLGDDGQAESAAAGVAGSGGVHADEALQNALAVGFGYSGTVLVDDQDHGVVRCGERKADAGAGLPCGVLDEVVSTRRGAGPSPITRPAETAVVSTRSVLLARTSAATAKTRSSRSTGRAARHRRSLVGGGQHQQIRHESLHPQHFGQHGFGQAA